MWTADKRVLLLVVVLILAVIGHPGLAETPSAADYVDDAITFYKQENCTKAIELLKKAIELNPGYARAYSWLGLCYVKIGRTREAVEAFRRVIALAPDSEDARVARRWLNRLQPPAPPLAPTDTSQPPAASRPPSARKTPSPGPVYLVDLPAAAGVGQEERPPRVQLFGQVFYKALVRELCDSGEEHGWRVSYNLQRKYIRFTAQVGLADREFSGRVVAKFVVRGDGVTLFESRPKKVGDVPDTIDVNVGGVLQLELTAWLEEGGVWYCGNVVWADPRVYPPEASLPTPAAPPDTSQLPAASRPPSARETPPPGPVYLVDLPAAVGVGQEERPPRVQLFGEVFYKSLARKLCYSGEQYRWRVVYNLQRRYVRLTARVGVADGEPTGSVVAKFVVLGDGAVLFESRPKKSGDVPDSLDVDVRVMLQLELVAWLERSGTCWDVVWADPRVYPPETSLPTPAPDRAGPGSGSTPPSVTSVAGGAKPAPAAATPTSAARAIAVFPFADSSGSYSNAGTRVASAVLEELFKMGKVETVSQQRLSQAATGRVDPLDVEGARQVAQRVGARWIVLGIVERYQVYQGTAVKLIVVTYYKEAFVDVAFQVIDVATGERILTDRSHVKLRSTALESHRLPPDGDMLREATRRVGVDIAQKVALVWAQHTSE